MDLGDGLSVSLAPSVAKFRPLPRDLRSNRDHFEVEVAAERFGRRLIVSRALIADGQLLDVKMA